MKKHISLHPPKEEGSLRFQVEIDSSELIIKETPFGVQFDLGREYKVQSEAGTPALPSKVFQVALPGNVFDVEIETSVKKCKKLFKSPVFIMPTPEFQVASKPETPSRPETELAEKYKGTTQDLQDQLRAIPTPQSLLKPDPQRYNKALTEPAPVAEITSTIVAGSNTIANIKVRPVTINREYIPELNEQIEIRVKFSSGTKARMRKKMTVRSFTPNKAIQQAYISGLKDKVINPRDVIDVSRFPWEIFGNYDYVVITDNYRWDSEKITPLEEVGDLRSTFQKLVDWKKEKGLKARVVTVTDIVNGKYGNFKTGAVDLQEVLRNFLKYAHSNWGVTWCLLGGDTEVIPVRQAAGEIRGDVNEQAVNNPPKDNEAFWTGTFLKIKAVSLGEWFAVHDSYLKLTNKLTGRLIPKKAPFNRFRPDMVTDVTTFNGFKSLTPFHLYPETQEQFRSRLGWYFCTDETYSTYSATPTQFVRVDGAPSTIHAPLRFHYTWNTIPTDFYYSSLFGPSYGLAGKHDWDLNNNRIYGQHEGVNEFDPINWNADVIVGRAPASNPTQADTFVNKVISYEKFRSENGARLDRNYIDKMLLISENWGGRIGFNSTTSNPPEARRFFTQAAQGRAIIQTDDDFTQSTSWQLISYVSDSDARLLPYNRNAGPSSRGWYYAFSGTDLRQAVITIPLPWGSSIEFPLITHTLVVYGNASEITPSYFILDHVDADGSMMDQEGLRTQVNSELSFVNRFDRLYEDLDSLPLINRLAAPLRRITTDEVRTALNAGQHFVSLSGHGNMYYCCKVENGLASTLTNTNRHFILFADSCLTNSFSTEDAMAEALLNNPNGGAVGYLGHTRFSWIGVGDDYQRAFFHELLNSRHLGLMHNSRLSIIQADPLNHYHKWTVLALNLLGDPEMEVWTKKPYSIFPDFRFYDERIHVRVIDPEDFARKPLREAELVAYIGDTTYRAETNHDGLIELPLEWAQAEDLKLVFKAPGSLPFTMNAAELAALMKGSEVDESFPESVPEQEEQQPEVITIPIDSIPTVKAEFVGLQTEPN